MLYTALQAALRVTWIAIRWGRAAGAAAVVLACVLASRPSAAQTNGTSIRLEYDAAEGCPGRDAFVARLRARTAHFEITLTDPLATTYRITLRSGDESRGQVESREPSGAPIVQALHGPTCDEVADALALVLALALDTRAEDARAADASALTAAPLPSPPVARVPASAPRERAPDQPVDFRSRPPRWAISSTAGVGVTGPFFGPEAFLEASLVPASGDRSLSLLLDARLGASYRWSRAGNAFGDVAHLTRTSALLDLCPLRLASGRFEASACARGEAGALAGSGGSLDRTRSYLAVGALVVAHWTLWDRVFAQVEGGAVAPLVRDRFLLDGIVVYAVSPVDALGSVSAGVRFR